MTSEENESADALALEIQDCDRLLKAWSSSGADLPNLIQHHWEGIDRQDLEVLRIATAEKLRQRLRDLESRFAALTAADEKG